MSRKTFTKVLTANDTGESGAHQAGIHIPKGEEELIAFLPELDAGLKNADAWLTCMDECGKEWAFRYIHYNNKLHDPGGTRDEYRITHMTKYFRDVGAHEGDELQITGEVGIPDYEIRIVKAQANNQSDQSSPIRLQGWRREH
ncbi:MAG: restriction endonuclease [Alphaproteobacteria bacterium]|nr:restriction endonuclease [Alphaproteobacteria bacterium]NCT40034.1 restriction endonuclease [Alphaproteobacteria bacterium]